MKKIFMIFVILFSCDAFAYYNETIPNQCGVFVNNNMYAIFTPNVHTCVTGYFLPANTDGCRPCPNDYVCNGGTFTFNERQSQGIVYKNTIKSNVSYACAINMPHNLTAVFTPNIINVVWSDTNSNDIVATNSGTFTYDGDIHTPLKPIDKPGMRFTGWSFSSTPPSQQ